MFAATRSRCGGLAFAAALLCACAAPAWAAVPSGYGAQRVDGVALGPERGFGAALAAVGDLDGDGSSDFVIGAPGADNGRGAVAAISGDDGSTIWRVEGLGGAAEVSDGNLALGGRVARLGDVAGCGAGNPAGADCSPQRTGPDGVADILVSALGGNAGVLGPDQGRVYVLDGRTGAIHRRLRLGDDDLPPTGRSAEFGHAIASAGDLDGDGRPEVVVGAPGYDETYEDTVAPACEFAEGVGSGRCAEAGRVYVFPSGPLVAGHPSSDFQTDLATTVVVVHSPVLTEDSSQAGATGARFGASITPFGGAAPGLAIGAPLVDGPAVPDAGAAFLADGAVLSGESEVLSRIDSPNPETGGRFGAGAFGSPALGAVAGATAPVVVGAPSESAGRGRAYLFEAVPAAPALVRTFESPDPAGDAGFGTSAARVGSDMPAIASPLGQRPGTVHLFNPDGTLAQTICDPDGQAGAWFGASVASLGDVNGDGLDDLAVGSPGYDHAGGANGGRAYILSSRGPATAATGGACVSTGGGSGGGAAGGGPGDGGGGTDPDVLSEPDDEKVVIARVLRRLVLSARPKRLRRARSFRLRGRLRVSGNRSACQRRQKIALQRRIVGKRKGSKRKSARRFQTFEVAVTRASGRFTARARASRTYVYRARVSRTSRCMGAVSKTAKVTVLRKRGSR